MSSTDSITQQEALRQIRDLEDRVTSLESLAHALEQQNRKLKRVLAGSNEEFAAWNDGNMVPLHERIESNADTLADHDEKFEMFVVEDGKQATPDQRAMQLRQVLLNTANENESGVGRLRRESAESALGGGLHKGTVLDAMRRAADGSEAKIDGASDLQPVDAVEFNLGGTVGSDGDAEQSYVDLDTSLLTGTDARQILTTDEGVQEDSA